MELTQEQLNRLNSLGITNTPPPKSSSSLFPLLSISGVTLLSLGSLILLKSKQQNPSISIPNTIYDIPDTISPTQVPKSIQHYLLSSQQFFSEALRSQSQNDQNSTLQNLNQAIVTATEAIRLFPQDFRGYQQRGHIYQSLIDSQPQLISQAISDFSIAQKLNPSSAEITRALALLFAKKGDTQNTLVFLAQTINLEPTKAQNFYDLARLQQQIGLIPQAVETYNSLLPLITDLGQKTQVESEKISLENLLNQSHTNSCTGDSCGRPSSSVISPAPPSISPTYKLDSPTLQASTISSLIIAAPETKNTISVKSLTDSNALSGTTILPANQTSITLQNSNLLSSSQVYVTITKGGKNQNLQVVSKSKNSFTVGLQSPINEDIKFKWWIIN